MERQRRERRNDRSRVGSREGKKGVEKAVRDERRR